jgi:transmembrane sensor
MDEDEIAAERRRAEAAQWFARLKALPVSYGTLKDFFVWRRDRDNAAAFAEAELFWSEAEKVGERPSILRAVEESAARCGARHRLGGLARSLALLTASLTLVAIIFAGIRLFTPTGQAFRTVAGEQRAVELDDGSRLNLDTQTAVKVRFTPGKRDLVLENGEALFNVAKDKTRPFTVKAGGVTVTATGTRFDVEKQENRITVTLVEGSVVVRAPGGSTWSLRPAEQWRWPADGPSVRTVRPETVTAWTQGRVVFDATRLADAIAEINRYGGQTIILDAPQLGARQISGSFEAGDEDSFATAVTALLPLRRTLDGQGRIRLTADEAPAK